MMESLSQALQLDRNLTVDVFTAILGALVVGVSLKATHSVVRRREEKIIRSPRESVLSTLSASEQAALPYPPDAFPGGRDVDSPFGSMRVFEWGPENGRRVIFVHGITTSCLALGAVAQGMADRGCRVMLFDLWGRGYSDSPDLPHDERLYSTQILLAIASSPLPWTGGKSGGFSIIAYSLGACISTSFTAHFPDAVKSLVLLCPTGLIRPQHLVRKQRVLFAADYVPTLVMERFAKKTLQKPMYADENKEPSVEDLAKGELKEGAHTSLPPVPVSRKYPDITVMGAVQWHLHSHPGFVRSFLSTLRYAPISGQEEEWKKLGLRQDKIMIVAGSTDPIIIPEELKVDTEALLGKDKIDWNLIEGAHDIPVTEPEEICKRIAGFWGL
ncbi:alpha beta hydrolase family [Phlyctema vagabunda]|uniref:Alpha beta hydrolase family n=1 Tax=Phlyctema vagabunda TaxID=108571 RepID=A0ABR4PUD4_9HELO